MYGWLGLCLAGFDIKRPVEEATELLTELNHVVSGHGSVGSAACLPSDSLVATAHAVPTVARAEKLRMVLLPFLAGADAGTKD